MDEQEQQPNNQPLPEEQVFNSTEVQQTPFTPPKSSHTKVIISVVISLVVLFGGLAAYGLIEPQDLNDQFKNTNEVLLYEKQESWGPCPNPEGGCFLNTYLYSSGRLVLESLETEELQLSSESVDKITSEIKNSGVMKTRCKETEVVDYWATYNLNIDRKNKTIRFPGCEDELKLIDNVIEREIENAREDTMLNAR